MRTVVAIGIVFVLAIIIWTTLLVPVAMCKIFFTKNGCGILEIKFF